MDDQQLTRRARGLAAAIEPVAGQVYFSPECHANYEALGFGPSPGDFNGVAGPEMESYFCSRGSVMGQVPGSVIAAAFGVFNHAMVERIVERGWAKTDAPTICQARDDGAVAQLRRVLGDRPDGVDEARTLLERANADLEPYGKPLYAGLAALVRFDDPLADCWRLADRLREYRGDAHTAAWTSVELDACQIGVLSELYWGLPARSYSRTRMWSDEQYDAAEAALEARGLLTDHQLTDDGRAFREEIEVVTDRGCRPIVEALGDDVDALTSILGRWGASVRDARGYPASGPHDLADAAT
ncbi:hypothetical protein NHL50_19390 [Acidimicrobiia bacterium EGI L10123]|uniref:SCO6745 family protein n=1 Tax=Salinilacustrithrix flava TaxID=2957203 RepID=UPI003D7C315F|nr:hypothetical protein [Acidimicrobiia bacterium EGI L10123]